MTELTKLRDERNKLDLKIKELEENILDEVHTGKCFKDIANNDYFKLIHVYTDGETHYIKINLEENVKDMMHDDYDSLWTFVDDDDVEEISKDEFNIILDKAIEIIKSL
jgi:hypothetical protein